MPEYRRVHAEVKVDNPYHGLVPFILPDEIAQIVCVVELRDPIGSFVDLLANPKSGTLLLPFPPGVAAKLMQMQDSIGRLYPTRTVGRSQVASILDVVRTTVLQWSLKLEQQGVVGSGMTFSSQEREIAARTMHVTIEKFQGILGDVSRSSVTQQLSMDVRKGDLKSVRSALEAAGASGTDVAELETCLRSEPTPDPTTGFGPKVSAWIGKMVTKAATGGWQISAGAAGDLLAKIVAAYYGMPGAEFWVAADLARCVSAFQVVPSWRHGPRG